MPSETAAKKYTFGIFPVAVDSRIQELGISQGALAKRAGLCRDTLNAVLIGNRRATDTTVGKLASALGCHPNEISGWL